MDGILVAARRLDSHESAGAVCEFGIVRPIIVAVVRDGGATTFPISVDDVISYSFEGWIWS